VVEPTGAGLRAAVDSLQVRHAADRGRIDDLEAHAAVDRAEMDSLLKQHGGDRLLIEHLEVEGVADRHTIAHLEVALITARRVGAAMGILMARRQLSDVQAFHALREASQGTHTKLRDIAERVIETGELPPLQ
jgi:hypothetical protein